VAGAYLRRSRRQRGRRSGTGAPQRAAVSLRRLPVDQQRAQPRLCLGVAGNQEGVDALCLFAIGAQRDRAAWPAARVDISQRQRIVEPEQ